MLNVVFEMIWGAAEGSGVSDCCYQRGGDKSSLCLLSVHSQLSTCHLIQFSCFAISV